MCCFSTTTEENLRVDNILEENWEIEDHNPKQPVLSLGKQNIVKHFHGTHSREKHGRPVMPFPIKRKSTLLGESACMVDQKHRLSPSLPSNSSYELRAKRVVGLLRTVWWYDCCPFLPAYCTFPAFGFLGFFVVYLLRASLSIAIVVMVNNADRKFSSLYFGGRLWNKVVW